MANVNDIKKYAKRIRTVDVDSGISGSVYEFIGLQTVRMQGESFILNAENAHRVVNEWIEKGAVRTIRFAIGGGIDVHLVDGDVCSIKSYRC